MRHLVSSWRNKAVHICHTRMGFTEQQAEGRLDSPPLVLHTNSLGHSFSSAQGWQICAVQCVADALPCLSGGSGGRSVQLIALDPGDLQDMTHNLWPHNAPGLHSVCSFPDHSISQRSPSPPGSCCSSSVPSLPLSLPEHFPFLQTARSALQKVTRPSS